MQKRTIFIITTLVLIVIIGVYYFYTKVSYTPSLVGQPTPINTNSDSKTDQPPLKEIPIPGTTTPVSEPPLFKISKNTDQKWQEKICKNLSEDECTNNDNCLGKYDSGPCTTSIPAYCVENFNSCVSSGFNPEEIQQIKTECDKVNGEFKTGKIGPYCICNLNGQNRCLEDLISQLRNN